MQEAQKAIKKASANGAWAALDRLELELIETNINDEKFVMALIAMIKREFSEENK
jgi:hypothetical protein